MIKKQTEGGFSLIELMIVVAIIGVLASVAVPSYLDSIRKGKRAEGRAALVDLLQQQERYFGQNGTYAAFTNGTGVGANFKVFSGDKASGTSYLLTATTCVSPNDSLKACVLVSAVPQFTDTEAGTLTANSIGTKSCSGTNTSICWK
jgi:type IV pilus assembly protein PilE